MQDPRTVTNCSTKFCSKNIQATCTDCKQFFCFDCSLKHLKRFPEHQILEFDDYIKEIGERSQQLIRKLKMYHSEALSKKDKYESSKSKSNQDPQYDQRLNPEKFQQQLNYISGLEKQAKKIVEKFFSELSLELINIWETYLNKFSNPENCVDQIKNVLDRLQRFSGKGRTDDKVQFINMFYNYPSEQEVEKCRQLLAEEQKNLSIMPICPELQVGPQMLFMISELLCNEASTKNYQFQRQKIVADEIIHISTPDTIDSTVKFIPIFPIRKQYCYLYNVTDNSYQIQEFDKLDFLPAFPKSIILYNGDIHLLGGTNLKQQILNTHIVFRSLTSEVFKLSNMPVCRNPVNGLLSKNSTIYMVGGLNQRKQWDADCYSYTLERKQWTKLASMKAPKPHQSLALFENKIFCFGIPSAGKTNIEQYDIVKNQWTEVVLTNFLCNPFNFATGFSCIQINDSELLLFGGKKYVENLKNQKKSTDRAVTPYIYTFQPSTSSFSQVGPINPCIGVRDGQINPIIKNGKIYAPEYIISRNLPICRWLSAMHVLEISNTGKVESVLIMHED